MLLLLLRWSMQSYSILSALGSAAWGLESPGDEAFLLSAMSILHLDKAGLCVRGLTIPAQWD